MKTKHQITTVALLLLSGASGFGQTTTFTVANAGNWGPVVAPDSIAAGFGTNLTTQQYSALATPLPLSLGGVKVDISDVNKLISAAPLYMASAGQVNFLVPSTVALGKANITVANSSGSQQGALLVSNVAPAIFAANGNGSGAAAGQILQVTATGSALLTYSFVAGGSGYSTLPFSLVPSSSSFYLILYGTGIRRHSSNPVQASIGGVKVPIAYAGPVGSLAGLDQINIGPLPQTLAATGKGDVDVVLTVDGVPANTVKLNIQ